MQNAAWRREAVNSLCLNENMDNKKNYEEQNEGLLKRRTEELRAVVRVAQLINIIDLDGVLAQTLKVTMEVVGATKGSFFLLDANGLPIQRFITQRDLPPEMTREVARDVLQKGLAGWCIRHKQGAIVGDVDADERWHVFADDYQDDVHSAICIPVLYDGEPRGVMTLVSPDYNAFDEYDLQLLTTVAHQSSTAIRNAQLFDDLQTKQRQLELVLQNTGEALITVDSDFKIVLVNPEAHTVMQVGRNTPIVGQYLLDVAQNSIFQDIVNNIKEAHLMRGSQSFEIRDEGNSQDFVVTVSALIGDGIMQGYVIVLHDVTSFKNFARLKTQMLRMMTHDLKNPINIIWGYIDLLRVDTLQNLPADQRFIDGILRAVQRMDNLIEDTLKTEKFMSADGQMHRRQNILPTDLIQQILDDLHEFVIEKHLTIVKEYSPNIDKILGDRLQIQEAIMNLVSNAIKYTPKGGTITLHAHIEGDRFYFSVEDTGLGIPKDLQGQLFKQFYRATRPQIDGIVGSGLGLSLVKTAVENHQGQVWFKSEENVGSTFGFWIPLEPPQKA